MAGWSSSKAEILGAIGALLGIAGGIAMLFASTKGARLVLGVGGFVSFLTGMLLTVVSTLRLAHVERIGTVQSLWRCLKRLASFIFWFL
jgi:hypothetical protein